jgi:uncharacterized membrane-anchored protein YjiN (DUF445 family)
MPSHSPPPAPQSEPPPASLVRMRLIATGLLAAMSVVFLLSHAYAPSEGAWSYVRAFAEAAMVGGLADWFAVTALFRRPLGLPIPHTAVIPRSQDRIADAVGAFIADNFLKPELVDERTREADLAAGLGRWLADPSQAASLADGVVSATPGLLETLDDEAVAGFLRREAANAAGSARLAQTAGSILEALVRQGRHQAILDALLKEGIRLLERNEADIRERVRTRTGWFWRMVDVDKKPADAMIGALDDLLREAAADPRHPLRRQATTWVLELSVDLRDDPELQRKVETWVRDALAHPAVTGTAEAVWVEIKRALLADCARPDSRLRVSLEGAILRIGEGLVRETAVREALNTRLRALSVELARRHGPDVSRIVSETIRGWDATTMVAKLEANVGSDLQFIRINGTLIGGLVGLALHAGGELLS